MRLERNKALRGERHRSATPRRLGLAQYQSRSGDAVKARTDAQRPCIEVYGVPAQSERLASSEPEREGKRHECFKPVSSGGGE